MAQSASSSSSPAPRPLPRQSFSPPRSARPPRFQPLDGVWMGLLAALSLLLGKAFPHPLHAGTVISGIDAVTVAFLYLLGWRGRDRATGIFAGMLLATSLPFVLPGTAALSAALFVLLTAASLFAFMAGSSLAALILAGAATAVRPDGVLLGIVLVFLVLTQKRKNAALGAAGYVLVALLGWFSRGTVHGPLHPLLHMGGRFWLVTWAVSSGVGFLTWFLLPFCAEMIDPQRRARWLPVALWVGLYLVVESFFRGGGGETTLFCLMPFWFLLCAAGLSRLLPAITGDIPVTWARYGLAFIALVSLAVLHLRDEHLRRPAPSVLPAAASFSLKLIQRGNKGSAPGKQLIGEGQN